MGEIERLPYGSYPKYHTDDELDHLAINAITQILEVKRKSLAKTEEKDQTVSIDDESVRSTLESETNFRLGLLPLDLAIRRVAEFDGSHRIVDLNLETKAKLQKEKSSSGA